MAKSLRSKIKRRFRTELRQRIGVPHLKKQEAKIQEQLHRAIESQVQGSSFMGLKKLMGGDSAPVATAEATVDALEGDHAMTEKEVELLNEEEQNKKQAKLASQLRKKHKTSTKRKKKFVQFHTLRKKGV